MQNNAANFIAPTMQAYRASVLHFTDDPAFHPKATAWFEDGLLLVSDGKVLQVGDYARLKSAIAASL